MCAGLSAMVAIVIASSTLIPVTWPRPRACASALRLMPLRAVSASKKSMGLPVCLAMNLTAAKTIAIDAGLFSPRCRCARYPLTWLGRDLAGVEARGDLYETLVDVAIDFCGLLDLFAPIQKVGYGVAVCPFGIESNGLELERLRRLGNGLFGSDAQSVHVVSFLCIVSRYERH